MSHPHKLSYSWNKQYFTCISYLALGKSNILGYLSYIEGVKAMLLYKEAILRWSRVSFYGYGLDFLEIKDKNHKDTKSTG